MRTHYETLQVTRDASPEIIRAAYRQLVQKWHPDKHPGQAEEAARMIREINVAYEVLENPDRRRAYDATLNDGDDARQEQLEGEHVYMANEVAQNRAAWIECLLLLVLIPVIGGQAQAGNYGYGVALVMIIVAGILSQHLKERFHVRIANRLFARPPLALKRAYDRTMSMRVLHLVGRGAIWVLLGMVVWNGTWRPYYASQSNDSETEAASPGSKNTFTPGLLPKPATSGVAVPVKPPPASEYALRVTNSCFRTVRVAVRFRQQGRWRTESWWTFNPNQSFQLDDAGGRELRVDDQAVYIYAESTDGQTVWRGNASRNDPIALVAGRALAFMHANAVKRGHELHAVLTCRP